MKTESDYIPGKTVTTTEYDRVFDSKNEPGSGFSFVCDENGIVIGTHPNYFYCISPEGRAKYNDLGVRVRTNTYREPDEIRCTCGSWVVLDSGWANGCDNCHQEYNESGQRLAPRRFWGEETGETF